MAHDIAKRWRSQVTVNGVTQPDLEFDLQQLNDQANNVAQCKHGTRFIFSGSVEQIGDGHDPQIPGGKCYLVRFDEPPGLLTQVQYRGVAMYSGGQFHKIVGIRKTVFLPFTEARKSEASTQEMKALAAGQDEGTWTGTQP